MQVKHLEYVVEIAQAGSITVAAKKLFMSQQALSEKLKLLEKELGFPLFERSRNGIKATRQGERILQDLETILPIIGEWGNLQVGNKPSVKVFVQYLIKDMLTNGNLMDCISQKNQVYVEWDTSNAREMLDIMENDEDVIGILNGPVNGPVPVMAEKLVRQGRIDMDMIANSRMAIVFSKEDELSRRSFLQKEDLFGKHLVHNYQFGTTPHLREITDYTRVDGVLLPNTVNVLEYLMYHKDTISYMPELVLRNNYHVQNGDLCVRYLTDDVPYMMYLLYHKNGESYYRKCVEDIRAYLEGYISQVC